ncbi:MAG: hypothetical protein HQK55_05755, partial [Deltaproteobacteria bacterium]|nr:hypothetical protein [Deltaproteobacteria bacterium]
MISKHFSEFINKLTQWLFYAKYKYFFNHPESYGLDLRLRRRAGPGPYVRLRGRLAEESIKSANPSRNYQVLVTVSDLTETKQIEAALRKSEKRYAIASKLANLGYWELGLSDNIISFSTEVNHIIGIESNQGHLTLESFTKFIHQSDRERVIKAFRDAFN